MEAERTISRLNSIVYNRDRAICHVTFLLQTLAVGLYYRLILSGVRTQLDDDAKLVLACTIVGGVLYIAAFFKLIQNSNYKDPLLVTNMLFTIGIISVSILLDHVYDGYLLLKVMGVLRGIVGVGLATVFALLTCYTIALLVHSVIADPRP